MEAQKHWRGKTFQDLVAEAKNEIREISISDLKNQLMQRQDLVLLDVREPTDYQGAHIPGAINLPRGLLELDIDEMVPNQDQPIVAYCGGGSRSALAAQTLQAMGYENVYSLAGGYKGWIAQNS